MFNSCSLNTPVVVKPGKGWLCAVNKERVNKKEKRIFFNRRLVEKDKQQEAL
jgi:hypothetical protein